MPTDDRFYIQLKPEHTKDIFYTLDPEKKNILTILKDKIILEIEGQGIASYDVSEIKSIKFIPAKERPQFGIKHTIWEYLVPPENWTF
jgi:hypothetical protein